MIRHHEHEFVLRKDLNEGRNRVLFLGPASEVQLGLLLLCGSLRAFGRHDRVWSWSWRLSKGLVGEQEEQK